MVSAWPRVNFNKWPFHSFCCLAFFPAISNDTKLDIWIIESLLYQRKTMVLPHFPGAVNCKVCKMLISIWKWQWMSIWRSQPKRQVNSPFSQVSRPSSRKSKHLTRLGIRAPEVTKMFTLWLSVLIAWFGVAGKTILGISLFPLAHCSKHVRAAGYGTKYF